MVLIGTGSDRKDTNRWKHGPRVEDLLCIYSGFLPVVKSASGAGPGLTPSGLRLSPSTKTATQLYSNE